MPTFYTDQLPPSTKLPNDLFKKSADLSKKSIQDNPHDQRKDPNTCPHERSENWNSNQCADCGHTNIGGTRVADEERFAETAKIEDHQYLIDELKPILGTMQVTLATKPGENASRLGTGTLLELRESNTMAVVAFDCNPTCLAILGQEKYEYVEQDQKYLVVLPCLELKEFKDCHARRIHGLGITIEALIDFAYRHDCWNWPTSKVMRDIVLPATKDTRCRYADLPELNGCFGPATVFMSHCWGATFGDLIGAACHGARKDRVVWIDIFAVRQWPGNVADLDFRGVISRCEALVVSTSPVDGLKKYVYYDGGAAFFATDEGKAAKKALPFYRLWCIVELTAAIILNVPIVVKGGSVTSSNGRYEYDTKCVHRLMGNLEYLIDVDASECAVRADHTREMAVVRKLEGGSKGVNALVAGVVTGANASIGYYILEIDAFVCNEPESLRALNIPLGCEGKARKLAIRVLIAACSGGRELVVKELLLKWSVKVDDDQEGETERDDFMKKEKEKTRKWLIQVIDESGVLYTASKIGHIRVVERILEVVGINVNVNAGAPLYCATKNGHTKVVTLLLAAKDIDVNYQFDTGHDTLLYTASANGHTNVVKALLAAEYIKINDGALYIASMNGHTEVVKALLAAKDFNLDDFWFGRIALDMATKNNHTEIIQLLKDAGVAKRGKGTMNSIKLGVASSMVIICLALFAHYIHHR
jgi:hypothetical protein